MGNCISPRLKNGQYNEIELKLKDLNLEASSINNWESYFVTDTNKELLDTLFNFNLKISELHLHDLPKAV